MNEAQRILLISTGGTIEKIYDEGDGSLANKQSIIRERLLHQLRLPHNEVEVMVLMAKDSLYMTDADRDLIAATIADRIDHGDPIVVLHGTDTMAQTAEHCHKAIPRTKVPIVFTGAMRPLDLSQTDAVQNVAEALLACQIVPPGIYISFHNRVFTVPGVRKNKERGTFEAV